MILTILEAVAVLWIATFFGVTTWAVWYYGRDLRRTVTQYPAHRNGWDHADEDEHDRVGPEYAPWNALDAETRARLWPEPGDKEPHAR